VETAGVEPASEKELLPVSTYLVDSRISPACSLKTQHIQGIPKKIDPHRAGNTAVHPCFKRRCSASPTRERHRQRAVPLSGIKQPVRDYSLHLHFFSSRLASLPEKLGMLPITPRSRRNLFRPHLHYYIILS